MKNNTNMTVVYTLMIVPIILLLIIMALTLNRITAVSAAQNQQSVQQAPSEVPFVIEPRPQRVRQPEFRQPPYRNYKPRNFQQVGLLTSETETLPLYGKESAAYNNRWNYYTTTQGDQIYSIPVSHNNRDCTEDIGCEELFDKQNVSIFGKDGAEFQTKLYRIDQHPYNLEF